MVEYITPDPAVFTASAPVTEYVASALVTEYVAPAAVTTLLEPPVQIVQVVQVPQVLIFEKIVQNPEILCAQSAQTSESLGTTPSPN